MNRQQSGTVYVTRDVPNMEVKVLKGQHVVDNSLAGGGASGLHLAGEKFVTEGPTAQMLKERGFVEILRTVN